jgi:hypothetical protein
MRRTIRADEALNQTGAAVSNLQQSTAKREFT